MNKSEFINRFEKAMGNMNWEDKKEIIYDYEEYFANALAEGKTEEQAAEELGNPEEIALNYFQNEESGESDQGGFNRQEKSTFSKIIGNIVNSALNMASKSIKESLNREKFELNLAKETSVESADTLRISKCKSVDVKINKYDGKVFKAELHGIANADPKFPPELESSFDDGTKTLSFSINWQNQNHSGFDGKLIVSLPENFKGAVDIETVSGELESIPDGICSLNFKSVSGEIKIPVITLNSSLIFKTVSGNCKVDRVNCQTLSFYSVSGDYNCTETNANAINFESTSGDMKTKFSRQPEKIRIKSVSGGGNFKLPEKSGIKIQFKSVSGNVETEFPFPAESVKRKFGSVKFEGQCTGENLTEIECKTVSGSLKIKKGEAGNE